ncbi:MAG: hypothetical protein HOW71_22305, partial [Nonomuraea sp.]|nr:hypothetical protein [Nonomuraea sp.]
MQSPPETDHDTLVMAFRATSNSCRLGATLHERRTKGFADDHLYGRTGFGDAVNGERAIRVNDIMRGMRTKVVLLALLLLPGCGVADSHPTEQAAPPEKGFDYLYPDNPDSEKTPVSVPTET